MGARPLLATLLLLASVTACASPDPWEPMNRGFFWFNDKLDRYALEPVAKGYDKAMPDPGKKGVRNFFDHVGLPVVFLNDLLQLKFRAAGEDLLRLVTNTVFGFGGFFDVASHEDLAIPKNDEDFGQTLGVWGVPAGPYLMIPILGPSTVRMAVGRVADSFSTVYGYFVPIYVPVAATGAEMVNLRAIYLEEIAQSREDAFDYYVFVRDAYLQNLEARVRDSTVSEAESDEDLYYFDDEELEDEDL